jgi:hypothetical protein
MLDRCSQIVKELQFVQIVLEGLEVGCVLFDGRTSQAAFEQSHTAKATAIFKMSISRHPSFVSEVKDKIDCERRQDLD